jgi:four helix bundle protein
VPFQFEKLDVYQRSLNFVEDVGNLCAEIKGKIARTFIDQLSRASLSIPLNIAEGNGRWHKKEKRQFFWIARGSVFECVPILQILFRKKIMSDSVYVDLYEQLVVMSKMLTRLIQSVEDLKQNGY